MNNTTSQEYLAKFKETTESMYNLTEAKNHDYWGKDLAFKNFDLVETISNWRLKATDWLLVRMCDKLSRFATLLGSEWKVADEKITDTLLDLSNYSIITKLYLETQNKVWEVLKEEKPVRKPTRTYDIDWM